jgi:hypothetical protein
VESEEWRGDEICSPLTTRHSPLLADEPVILNNLLADVCGTVEFLGRDVEPMIDRVTIQVAVGAPGNGRLADPADVFGAARVCLR